MRISTRTCGWSRPCDRWRTRKASSVAQLGHCLFWYCRRGDDDIVPLIGARTRVRLTESLGALDVRLSAQDLASIRAGPSPRTPPLGIDMRRRRWAHLDSRKMMHDPRRRHDGAYGRPGHAPPVLGRARPHDSAGGISAAELGAVRTSPRRSCSACGSIFLTGAAAALRARALDMGMC